MKTKKNSAFWSLLLMILFVVFGACKKATSKAIEAPNLGDIQMIGSHNSYKIAIDPPVMALIYERDSATAKSLEYEHISLTGQLDLGLRSLELDILHDPKGGHFRSPLGLELAKQQGLETLPYDLDNDLERPGLKVFHIPDIDFRSHRLLFKDCLIELKKWSDQHPDHIPIIITMNAKDGGRENMELKTPLPFTSTALDSIDLEISQILPDEKLITPDDVRQDYKTLEEAVLDRGWPKLEETKGEVHICIG